MQLWFLWSRHLVSEDRSKKATHSIPHKMPPTCCKRKIEWLYNQWNSFDRARFEHVVTTWRRDIGNNLRHAPRIKNTALLPIQAWQWTPQGKKIWRGRPKKVPWTKTWKLETSRMSTLLKKQRSTGMASSSLCLVHLTTPEESKYGKEFGVRIQFKAFLQLLTSFHHTIQSYQFTPTLKPPEETNWWEWDKRFWDMKMSCMLTIVRPEDIHRWSSGFSWWRHQ